MTNVSVNLTNLRKGVWKNVYTTLNNSITGVSTRVYGSYPLKNIQLPLIIVENSNRGEDKVPLGDNAPVETEIAQIVSVYAKNAEAIDTLMDEIETAIRADSSTYSTYGMYLAQNAIEDNEGTGPFQDLEGNRMHSKSLTITFLI